MSPPLPLESLSSIPMPGVGDVVRGGAGLGLAAGFFTTAAGFLAGAVVVTGAGAGVCVLFEASCTAGRDALDALFTQLSGSSEQRDMANAAVANSEQAANTNRR